MRRQAEQLATQKVVEPVTREGDKRVTRFGEEWAEYKESTGMFFPKLRVRRPAAPPLARDGPDLALHSR